MQNDVAIAGTNLQDVTQETGFRIICQTLTNCVSKEEHRSPVEALTQTDTITEQFLNNKNSSKKDDRIKSKYDLKLNFSSLVDMAELLFEN